MKNSLLAIALMGILTGYILVFAVNTTYACSGGAPLTVEGLLERSDYIVKARPIESDDAGQNVILLVDSYLGGDVGPEYVLLNRSDPVFVDYILNGRSSGGDCLGLLPELRTDSTIYAFLKRDTNGTYFVVSTLFNPYMYIFPETSSTEEVFLDGGYVNGDQVLEDFAERGTGQDVTESEFLEIIASISGAMPLQPVSSNYPLKSPLLITTSNNTYLFPVDWQNPILVDDEMMSLREHPMYTYGFSDARRCSSDGDVVISPDNLNIAITQDDNTICFTWGHTVEGQSVLFSPKSDSVAIWDDCQLSIYSLGYPRLLQDWYDIQIIHSHELMAIDCQIYHQKAVWHPNGRALAYSDDEGIWLLNTVNPEAVPELLIPSQSETFYLPIHFSPLGRYLNFSNDETIEYIDIVSGETYPDGLFSPDEQILINFDSPLTSSGYEVCTILSFTCAVSPPMYITTMDESSGEVTSITFPDEIGKTLWESDSSFLQLACVAEQSESCRIFRFYPYFHGWNNSLVGVGIDFSLDRSSQTLAILENEYSVLIDGIRVDLSALLEEDIQNIDWFPSVFYYD